MSDTYKAMLKKFILKMHYVEHHSSMRGVYAMAAAHGYEYTGPNYEEEKREACVLVGLPEELPDPDYPGSVAILELKMGEYHRVVKTKEVPTQETLAFINQWHANNKDKKDQGFRWVWKSSRRLDDAGHEERWMKQWDDT